MQYGLPLAETVPLLAALLSLPLTADYAPLTVSPEQQKQQTLHALLTILVRIATQQPVLLVMEDLHWIDPTTLDFLSLLVDQGPTARILALFTFRPDFHPTLDGTRAPHPGHTAALTAAPGRRDGSQWRTARRCQPRSSRRSWPRPMACRCLWRS